MLTSADVFVTQYKDIIMPKLLFIHILMMICVDVWTFSIKICMYSPFNLINSTCAFPSFVCHEKGSYFVSLLYGKCWHANMLDWDIKNVKQYTCLISACSHVIVSMLVLAFSSSTASIPIASSSCIVINHDKMIHINQKKVVLFFLTSLSNNFRPHENQHHVVVMRINSQN